MGLLVELLEGVSESHTSGRLLAHRVMTLDFDGRVCKEVLWNMLRSVTKDRGMHQTSISPEGISIQSLFRGLSLSGG